MCQLNNKQLMKTSYLKAILESFAHQIQSNGINAGIQRCHVDTNVVQDQKKAVRISQQMH